MLVLSSAWFMLFMAFTSRATQACCCASDLDKLGSLPNLAIAYARSDIDRSSALSLGFLSQGGLRVERDSRPSVLLAERLSCAPGFSQDSIADLSLPSEKWLSHHPLWYGKPFSHRRRPQQAPGLRLCVFHPKSEPASLSFYLSFIGVEISLNIFIPILGTGNLSAIADGPSRVEFSMEVV